MTVAALPWERGSSATLAHRVAAEAARAIVERRIAAGALITEVDLAKDEGVSRTPAREAMLQLEAWGLVRLMPKKGAIVTAVTPEERRDLLAVRAMFEIESITALTRSDDGVATVARQLDAALAEQRAALADGDLLAFAAADYRFHASLIVAGGNAVIDSLLGRLAPRLARLTHQVCLDRPAALPGIVDEHQQLARQAREGDAVAFARTIRVHIHDMHFPEEQPA